MTNLNNVLKSRDITLLTKVHLVKGMVSLVVMYRCESWTIKKAECQRTDAFFFSGQNFKNHLFMNLEWTPSPPAPTHTMTRGKDGKQWCLVLLRSDDTILKSVY